MDIYLLIYIVLLLGVFIPNLKKNIAYLYFVIILFSILIGFRGEYVGDDTHNYISIYKSLGNDTYDGHMELLYTLACKFFTFLGFPFSLFQTVLVFFSFIFTVKAIRKVSPYYNLSLFFLFAFYFIFYAMNIYRQMLACFIIMSAFPFLLNNTRKGRIRFVLLVLFAACFHLSAIFLFPLLLINRIRINHLTIFIVLCVSFILGLLLSIENMAFLMGKYQNSMYEAGNERASMVKAVFLASYWMIEFLLLYFLSNDEMRKSVFVKIVLLAVAVNNLLIQQAYGLRVFLYYNMVQILLIPMIVKKSRIQYGVARLLLVVYISIFFFVFLFLNSASVVPYELNF